MYINKKLGEINLKIVYYGPGLSGKTTNLEYVHAKSNPNMRSELVSLKTREDRTIYFDFLQLELGKIKGLKPKFSLYTVPGQDYYKASRELVLQGADGVVFVADSQAERLQDNQKDLLSLNEFLEAQGATVSDFPYVLQFNKQDLSNALGPEEMKVKLGQNGVPFVPAVAIKGDGVFDTLKLIITRVMQSLN